MAISSVREDGTTVVLRENGRYEEATPEEAAVLAESTSQAVMRSAGENLRVTGGLIQSVLGAGMVSQHGRMAEARGDAQIADAAQNIETREFARPGASAAGALLGGLTEEALTAGSASIAVLGKRMLSEGVQSLASNRAKRAAATQAAEVAADLPVSTDAKDFNNLMADLPQANRPQAAADVTPGAPGSVKTAPGAESAATLEQMGNVPRWRDAVTGVAEKIGKGSGLSADQARLLSSGTVAKTGFRLFPGQASGSNVAVDVAETIPQFADIFSPITNTNGRLMGEKVARSVGLEPGAMGRDILSEGRTTVGRMFDNVDAAIQPQKLPDNLATQLDDALNKTERELFDLKGSEQTGSDIMELRSKLNSELSAERKLAAEGKRARQLETTLENFDDIIAKGLDDPAMEAKWAEARQRWRMVLALDKPGVIDSATGDISLKRLTGAMEKQFPNEFKRKLIPGSDKLPADMVDLMEFTRVARSYASNLPNSGTATRNLFVKAATNPVVYGSLSGAALVTGLFGD